MPTLDDALRERAAEIRRRLDADEQVLAIGRGEDITFRGGIEQGGAAWTLVMVTNKRLRWVPRMRPEFEAALILDSVTKVHHRVRAHRYAIRLEHPPISRPHHVPAHHFGPWSWGNAIGLEPTSHTELAFSRRDTAAARALRDQLGRRRILDPNSRPAQEPKDR